MDSGFSIFLSCVGFYFPTMKLHYHPLLLGLILEYPKLCFESLIRNRGLVQYFSPYSSADLVKMAQSFNTTLPDLENELMKLILDGSIQARIDSHNKVLLAQDVDQRSQIFNKAVEMCEMYQRRAKMLLLRSAILKANISVKVTKYLQ